MIHKQYYIQFKENFPRSTFLRAPFYLSSNRQGLRDFILDVSFENAFKCSSKKEAQRILGIYLENERRLISSYGYATERYSIIKESFILI